MYSIRNVGDVKYLVRSNLGKVERCILGGGQSIDDFDVNVYWDGKVVGRVYQFGRKVDLVVLTKPIIIERYVSEIKLLSKGEYQKGFIGRFYKTVDGSLYPKEPLSVKYIFSEMIPLDYRLIINDIEDIIKTSLDIKDRVSSLRMALINKVKELINNRSNSKVLDINEIIELNEILNNLKYKHLTINDDSNILIGKV